MPEGSPGPGDAHPPASPAGGWSRLASTAEGRILLVALALGLAGSVALGAAWLDNPETARLLSAMTVTNVLFGRAAGLSMGYASGLGHLLVIPVNMAVETVLVLAFYPLLVLGWNRAAAGPLARVARRTTQAAERHRDLIDRYGLPGLLLFVMVPFWMTGPVVGCAIGYLLGFRARVNLSVVLVGTYVAICLWALLLHDVQRRLAEVGDWGPLLLVAIIIGVAVAGNALHPRNK